VLGLTVLDVISGLKWKHFFDENSFCGFNLESFFLLDNGLVTLPSTACELVMIARQQTADRKLTWIGLYRSLPASLNYRPGDYFGAGVWVADGAVDAHGVTQLLRHVLGRLFKLMQVESRRAWDLKAIDTTGFGSFRDEMAELVEHESAIGEIGKDTICVDLSVERSLSSLEAAIDDVQDDLDGKYHKFNRILLSCDEPVIAAVRKLGRVAVRKPAEIVAMRRAVRKETQPAGRGGKFWPAARPSATTARDPAAMPVSLREPTGGQDVNSESDIFRLRRDMSRLTNELAVLRAESAKPVHDTRKSGALIATGALVVAAAALVFAWVSYFSIGAIQESLNAEQAKTKSLDDRITGLEKASRRRNSTDTGPGAGPQPSGVVSQPSGLGPSPPLPSSGPMQK
jgi:hypothetical protein